MRSTSRELKPASWLADRAPHLLRRLDALRDHDLGLRQGLLPRTAIGGAARQLRHFRKEGLVFGAPVGNDLVPASPGVVSDRADAQLADRAVAKRHI